MSKVSLHKAIMSPVSPGSYKLRNRFAMWGEPQMGLALGNHLSYEGVAAVVRQVERAFEMSFRCGEKKKARIEKGEDEKPDLPPSRYTLQAGERTSS